MMRSMPVGGYREGNSPIHKMDAFAKLLCTICLLGAVICSDTLPGYALMIAGIAAAVRISGIGIRNALHGIRQMWLFCVIIVCMNAVFGETQEPLWSWWILQPSAQGLMQGVHVVLRVVLAMLLSNLLLSTTSSREIIGAIESLLLPLKYLGVPVQDVAMTLGIAMQFIPILQEEADMIRKAQIARGARFESKKLSEKVQSMLPLVIPVFLAAFRRADELSVAMEARGYHRMKKRVRDPRRHLHVTDKLALLVTALLWGLEMIV